MNNYVCNKDIFIFIFKLIQSHQNILPQLYKSSNLQPPIEQGTKNLIQLFPNGKLCANNAVSNFQWKNQTQEQTIIFDNQICFPIFLCFSLNKYSQK